MELGANVKIGPFAVISEGAAVGDDVEIMAHAQVLPGVTIGAGSTVFHGAVLGGAPQDIKFVDRPTLTNIGEGVSLREYVTVNRGTTDAGTRVGDGSLLMAYVHVGHDSQIGKEVILANGVQLGGVVEIGNFAAIGGMTPVHQTCRIGAYAFVGGGYRVVQDVPPYILASGEPLRFGGLNVLGLRRQKMKGDARAAIKEVYRMIFRSEYNLADALAKIRASRPMTPEVESILNFVESSERGLI